MKVGLAQMDCKLGDLRANLERVRGFISEAKERKVELLVFPELSLTGYSIKSLVSEVAIRVDNSLIEDLKKESREISLVIGFVEESREHNFYNSALYLEKGRIKHLHRKVYLPNYGVWEEGKYLTSGERIRAFLTLYEPMTILICEDAWHPILPYISALDGASIFIHTAASFEKDLGQFSVRSTWEGLNILYAQLFSGYVIFVNRVGSEEGNKFWGESSIIDPAGKEVVKADYYGEQLVVGTVDREKIRRHRSALPLFRHERFDLAIRELNRVWKKRCESFNSGNRKSDR
jgi:predicted amidohydrolase